MKTLMLVSVIGWVAWIVYQFMSGGHWSTPAGAGLAGLAVLPTLMRKK